MSNQHPIALAADVLVKLIDEVNSPDHRQDLDSPKLARIIIDALRMTNAAGANYLDKLSPRQARQILSQRRPRCRHDDEAGQDDDQ